MRGRWSWWIGVVLCAALATCPRPAGAGRFVGVVEPVDEADDRLVLIDLRLESKGDAISGTVLGCVQVQSCMVDDPRPPDCAAPRPCRHQDAQVRFTVDEGFYRPDDEQTVTHVTGTLRLANGATCTGDGDVWTVTLRPGAKKRRGAVKGRFLCPPEANLGNFDFFFYTKGYDPKFSD
jgi:hypothetical protein